MGWVSSTYGGYERYIGYKGLVGPEGRKSLGIPMHRRDENIKIHLQEVACGVMDCIVVCRDRYSWGGACENGTGPSPFIKCGEFLDSLRNC